VPVRYCDEVWTGIEYQVAVHCIWGGMVDEGLEIVRNLRAHHEGTRRNPYTEIECGDHYARAMAGWTVLDALSGLDYDGAHKTIACSSTSVPGDVRYLFVVGTGWGTLSRKKSAIGWEIEIACAFGHISFETLRLGGIDGGSIDLPLDGQAVSAARIDGDDGVVCTVPKGFTITAGQGLHCTVSGG
jgi:non-lysosomal glucosylceramidase